MKFTFIPNTTVVHWRRHIFFLSLLYFLAACIGPALFMQRVSHSDVRISYWGLELLGSGWLGILFWGTLAWLANPCYFCALICFMHWGRGAKITFSAISLLFAMLTFELFFRSELSDDRWGSLKLVGFGSGFYFWVVSIAILFVAALADTRSGDAFFQHMLPRVQLGDISFPSAFLLTFVLSLPALTIGGTNFFTTMIEINSRNREYQEYHRNHPTDDRATREAKEREESVSLVGGSDRAVDWNQDGSDVQGDYITHSYNPRQFLPVDRSERPPP